MFLENQSIYDIYFRLWQLFEEIEKILSNRTQVGALTTLIEDVVILQELAQAASDQDLDCKSDILIFY